MQPDEQPPVIAALARAFYDDPLFGFFVPDLVKQQKALIAFMSSGVTDAAPFGEIVGRRTPTARSRARPCGSRPAPTRATCAAS